MSPLKNGPEKYLNDQIPREVLWIGQPTKELRTENMARTLTYKILQKHLVEGELKAGEPFGIRIVQTLTQDATGTTAFLLFE